MSITIHPDQGVTSDVRPWGSWEVLDQGPNYKVKRITVRGNSRLSLQTHACRSEYWMIVTGRATCTVGDRERVLGAGGSVHVPVGTPHRIGNDQEDDLILVEVQVGAYLGEDDIVRLEDDYGR
jgi:mannose-6-phosphate isomerase